MKNKFQIYLCGGMSKFNKENFEEGNRWRKFCKQIFESKSGIDCINPNDYFNFVDEPPAYNSEKEIMEFDLNKLRNSDLVIINFNDMYSLGSMAELAIAYEKRIPVIGLDEEKQKLHPWQAEMCARIFSNMNELIEYVNYFYL